MYGLICLYIVYFIYFAMYFKSGRDSHICRKIVVITAIKLVALTLMYLLFFSDKLDKSEQKNNVDKLILSRLSIIYLERDYGIWFSRNI